MIFLTLSSLVLNLIGMGFRVWLSKTAGAEVLGIHQVLYSVYLPACTLACSGINLAVTRLVTSSQLKGERLGSVMWRCLGYSFGFGLLSGGVLFSLSGFAETHLLKQPGSGLCLRILSFGLPFLSSVSAFHGMFTALRKVARSVAVQMTEDLSKMAVTAFVLTVFLRGKSPAEMCIALVVGSACAETLSCLCGLLLYLVELRLDKGQSRNSQKGLTLRLFGIALPAAASSYIRSALSAFENLMIPIGLRRAGMTDPQIYSRLGILHGMVMPTVMFPSVMLSSCSRLLVPEFSEAFEKGDREALCRNASKVIRLTLSFSFITTAVFIFFADSLGFMLFDSPEAGRWLRLMSPLIPLLYLDGIIDAMLKGINEQLASMRVNIIDSAVSAVAVAVLLPEYGFEGYFVITYVTCCLNAFMSLDRFLRVINLKLSAQRCIFLPCAAAFASVSFIHTVMNVAGSGNAVTGIVLSVSVYVGIMAVMGGTFRKKRHKAAMTEI